MQHSIRKETHTPRPQFAHADGRLVLEAAAAAETEQAESRLVAEAKKIKMKGPMKGTMRSEDSLRRGETL